MTTNTIAQHRPRNDSIPKIISRAEYAFCFIAIGYFTSIHTQLATYFIGDSITSIITSLLRYLVIFVSFGLLAFRWKSSLAIAQRAVLLWGLIAWSSLSYFWSELPEVTFLSLRGLLLPVVLFSLYFSTKYSLRQQVKILMWFFSIATFISFFLVFALPEIGRHPITQFDGAWRGLFGHKNGFSAAMALTLTLFLSALFGKEKNKIIPQQIAWAGVILTLLLILASTSKTGLFLLIIMPLFLLFYKRFRWFGSRSVLAFNIMTMLTITAVTIIGLNWEPILNTIGRDPTLTGRTEIWKGALGYWLDKFWLGYGIDAFWESSLPYSETIGMMVTGARRVTYTVPHSHNGYIDTLLALGFIGFALFLLTLLGSYRRAFRSAYLLPYSHLLWTVGFLILYTISNFSESHVLNRTGFNFMLYMTIYFSLLYPERELKKLDEDPIQVDGINLF